MDTHLKSEPDGARHELVLADKTDSVLAVATVPHHAGPRSVRPEWSVVLVVQVGQHHNHLDLLLCHHLPHAGDGGVQWVLGQNEAFSVVET